MQSDLIEIRVTDHAGTITMNRPDHENALTRQMIDLISDAIDDLYHEKKVRAIILTGAGSSFCQGVDLHEILDEGPAQALDRWGEDAARFRDLLLRILQVTKPVIAAVNGPAWSAGAGLVAACDIVVAADNASIGFPDPRFGLTAGVVAPLICYRLGVGHSPRLLLTSAQVAAAEARELGLFHELVKPDLVWARAFEIAKECAAGAPQAIQLTKRLIYETVGEALETQLSAGVVMRATSCTTDAAQEGISAYLEDRPPKWT